MGQTDQQVKQIKMFMQHPNVTRVRQLFLFLVISCCSVLCIVSVAHAQDQDPLRMVVINASERGGEQPRAALVEILDENEAIELIESEDVRSVMEDFGVNEKVLRKQSLRKKFRNRIMRLVTAKRIEGLLIVDTYNKGRTLQVVVLGPEGEELQDIRRTIKGGRLQQSGAVDVLQEVFPVLGPEVLTFRERQAENAQVEQDPTPQPDKVIEEKKKEEEPEEPVVGGYFNRGIDLGVGYYFGRRDLLVEETNNNNPDRISHGTFMSGVGAQLDATALAFGKENRSSLALRGAFAVGFFSTTFKETDINNEETLARYSSQVFDLAGDLVFRQMITSKLHLGAFGGVQNVVVKISQTSQPDEDTRETFNNYRYTGTGYTAFRLGAEAGFRFSDFVRADLHGGILPMFQADISQSLGESTTTVGAFAGTRLKLNFTRNFYVQAVYAFSLFRPSFPDPPGMVEGGGEVEIDSTASGSDKMHNLQAVIGLTF